MPGVEELRGETFERIMMGDVPGDKTPETSRKLVVCS